MIKQLLLLRLLSILIIIINTVKSDETVPDDTGIIELDSSKFYDTIMNNKHVLVEFYAPWCDHCKLFDPEYQRLAYELKSDKSEIRLAKVNGAKEIELMKNFNVRSYPTLILFVDQKPLEYKGTRHWKEIMFWASKKTGLAAIEISTVDELNAMKEDQNIIFLGLFKSFDSVEANIFKQTAVEFDSAAFAITTQQALFDEFKVSPNTVVALKSFDEGRVDFPADSEITEDTLKSFVLSHQHRLVTEFSSEVSWIFTDRIKIFCMLFVDRISKDYADQYYAFKEAAERFRGQVLFVFFDMGKKENKQMSEFLGVRVEDAPQIRLASLVDDLVKYKPENPEITASVIGAFVQDFLDDKLKPLLLSQDLPSDWNSKPVKVLVASNFNQVARDPKKTVLVAFYAPWCPRSQELEPIYNELAEKFSKRPNEFVIAKIDATKNELEEFKIYSLPTIKLFPKGSNQVIDFKGERTLEALSKFVFTLGKESDADEDLDKVVDGQEDDEEANEKDEL